MRRGRGLPGAGGAGHHRDRTGGPLRPPADPGGPTIRHDLESVTTLFPGTRDVAYLDNASVGLLPTRVHEAVSAVLTGHQQQGSVAAAAWRDQDGAVRASLARLVGGRPDGVAFTQNTSTGLAVVVNGLDWSDGDNVVVPEGEFPSNRYPWLQLRRRGVEVRRVPMTGGCARIEDLVGALDERTRVLAVSAVQYSSGHRYDLAALAQACRGHDVLLVVDGTQAVGALTVDVGRLGVDVLAVSAHKWVLGPFGIGFVHLSERAADHLVPSTVGWLSVTDPFAFDPEPELAPDARRFESGTTNAAGIAGLGAAVGLVHELGRDRVEERVLHRAGELASLLTGAGLTVPHRDDPERRSGIVIAASPVLPAPELHQRLLADGVRCSLRGAGIRFAPHYYTRRGDLDRAADAVRTALRG